ncbi:MAG: diguanylate cyclase (GGDEF)-like protein/PAS domain S-box-containing protein [Alphaproteobacteria bacterium]|jgi:diguanylate cyclase (GGDEF)-like protein/PAS domain S-box-containing protein
MHRLLKRQLKKLGVSDNDGLTNDQFNMLAELVNKAYLDADEDKRLIEKSLDVSSKEMQKLYEQIKTSAQTKIQLSEEKYNRLVQNLRRYYFFYTRNVSGEYTYLSDSVTDMLGYTAEEFKIGYKSFITSDPQNEYAKDYTLRVLNGEEIAPYVVQVYHKSREIRYVEIMQLPIFDEHDKVIAMEGIVRDITEQMNVRKQLDYIALNDTLTDIPNRHSLYSRLDLTIASAKYNSTQFALLFLDLDHFKKINDSLGHDIGDKLLQAVVKRIEPSIRATDIFARIGGDEFIIVLSNIKKSTLLTVIDKIMEGIRQDWVVDEFVLKVTSSVGIAMYPDDGIDKHTLMKHADIAMYDAKNNGRDNYRFFTENLNESVQSEMRLERDMVKAIENEEFILYFQPQVRVSDNAIVGAEALIRWQHPELGFMAPDKFIPLAEKTGLILKLGQWVIEESCRALARFNKVYNKDLLLAFNLSTKQIENDQLFGLIKAGIETNGIDPSQVHLEMTESIMVENTALALNRLNEIKTLGVNVSMDDFGTGYSSLSYLHQFPIDTLKIDKAFIDQIQTCGTEALLLDTIIAMGKTLGLKMVAEGVEHEYQRAYLKQKSCLLYQGYLFAKPLCEKDFIQLLHTELSR